MKEPSMNPYGMSIYQPPYGMSTYQPSCPPPLGQGLNPFIKGNSPQHISSTINPARVTIELPNRPVITQHREVIDLSKHPLAHNFDIEKQEIDPKDFRGSTNKDIEIFKRILDAADLFGCYTLGLCVFNSPRYPSLEMAKYIIQKFKSNPQFALKLYNEKEFNYFKEIFIEKEGHYPEQLLLNMTQEGRLTVYTCKFNHAFNASTRSISQTARVTLQRPITPSTQQTLTPQLSPTRSIPKTTPEPSRVSQKPPSPMREPARAVPQVIGQSTPLIPASIDTSKLSQEQKRGLEFTLLKFREGKAALQLDGKIYYPSYLQNKFSTNKSTFTCKDGSKKIVDLVCVSDTDFELILTAVAMEKIKGFNAS